MLKRAYIFEGSPWEEWRWLVMESPRAIIREMAKTMAIQAIRDTADKDPG